MIAAGGGGNYFASIPGDPGAIRSAAGQIGRLSAQIGAHGSAIDKQAGGLVGSGWIGPAASRYSRVSNQLAGVHCDIENILGSLPGALDSYADELEAAQEQVARAEQLMGDADEAHTSAMASLPAAPAHPGSAAAEHYQATVDGIGTTYQQQSSAASHVAGTAMSQHQVAVTRLTSHLRRVSDEGSGVDATLTRIGDSLGVPVAVLSALSTIALLRASGRLATVGPAFASTAAQESEQLTKVLASALVRGDITIDEGAARIVSFSDHLELASQMYTNAARADVGAGGLLNLGRFTGAAKWVGRGAGVTAILGDAYTVWHPDEGGTWGHVEQGMAVANGVATGGSLAIDGFGLAEAGGLLAANTALDWVPVAGQVLAVGTGLYLLGNYLYSHTKWFHNGIDDIGHGFAIAGEAVGHVTVATVNAIGTGSNDVDHTINVGLDDAGHAISAGLSDSGQALGSAAHAVASFLGL